MWHVFFNIMFLLFFFLAMKLSSNASTTLLPVYVLTKDWYRCFTFKFKWISWKYLQLVKRTWKLFKNHPDNQTIVPFFTNCIKIFPQTFFPVMLDKHATYISTALSYSISFLSRWHRNWERPHVFSRWFPLITWSKTSEAGAIFLLVFRFLWSVTCSVRGWMFWKQFLH